MKICVLGLWHLGSTIASCLAECGYDVLGIDEDKNVVHQLNQGQPPIFEPGLTELLQKGIARGVLTFSDDFASAKEADLVWITYDTPVDEDDNADVAYVCQRVLKMIPLLKNEAVVLISSQLPVGTTSNLSAQVQNSSPEKNISFAYSPENVRLGKSIASFMQPDRIIVGSKSPLAVERITKLLAPITDNIIWMGIESAEMTKHALNTFLALSVTYINEIASICEAVGADAQQVAEGLKSEPRIGRKSYLNPGSAFAGGTLARDVSFLSQLSQSNGCTTPLISAICKSNDSHKLWALERLKHLIGELRGQVIAVLGLTYKPGTDTLRRSGSLELCKSLIEQGAVVRVHDPVIKSLPSDIAGQMRLVDSVDAAVSGAQACVISTEWPEYRQLDLSSLTTEMNSPIVIDANSFLQQSMPDTDSVRYVTVGRS